MTYLIRWSFNRMEYARQRIRLCALNGSKGVQFPAALIMPGTITLLPASHSWLSKYSIHDKVIRLFPGVNSPVDNYLQYAPLAALFALKASGVRSRSDLINQLAITAKAELLMSVIVLGMKSGISSTRPSGAMHSMPSGHTAQAFVSATILDMEYRDTSPWISVAGYAAATTTGMYRMINNKHWISDVLIGAGIGIFSTKVVYYTHRYRWMRRGKMFIFPALLKGGRRSLLFNVIKLRKSLFTYVLTPLEFPVNNTQ